MGKAVYRGMDQATLEREYDARGTVADIAPFLDQYAALSAEMRATLPVHRAVAYGRQAETKMDIFPGPEAGGADGAPVFLFIHGGYWRLLSRADSAFMAGALHGSGIATIALDYALAPAASLDDIVHQVRQAVAFIWREGHRYGLDRNRIHVGGSSAGGHLTGMVLGQGWHQDYGVPETVLAGAFAASGLFDLEPVRLCTPNSWLHLSEEDAARLSPLRHLPEGMRAASCPLIVTYADGETDEFKRQSRDYAQAWGDRGFPVTCFEEKNCNHFDVILRLAERKSRSFQALENQILGC